MTRLRIAAASGLAFAVSALATTPAFAQITIGQLAPGSNPNPYCVIGSFDGAASGSASSAYTVPTGGVITSWSTNASEGAGQELNFKVYRPLGGRGYLVVGHDKRALAPGVINTFETSIPVRAGDLIGNADTNASTVSSACEFETGNPEDLAWFAPGDAPDGATVQAEAEDEEGVRANETATILPPPTVAGLTPAKGSVAGGARVVISGSNFAQVRGIGFGASPAPSFTLESESQITATVPSTATPDHVSVTVTTVAGTAAASQQFEYQACIVPRLRGKTLKIAKKKLRKASCRLGKVIGGKSKAVTVTKQKPKPGRVLGPNTKVNVRLG